MKRSVYIMLGILLLAAHSAFAGLYYSALNTTEGSDSAVADWRVNAWIEGNDAKIEFVSSGNPMMPSGSFLLTNDAGETVYMVKPTEGTYSLWDIDAMLAAASSILEEAGGMVKINFENSSVETLAEEAGEEMLGHDTTYHRYRTSYDIKMKIMGMRRAQSTVTNQEIWATELDGHPAFGVWLRKEPASFGDSGLDELIRMEAEKIKGFPLKMITDTVIAGRKGRETKTRTVMEVTELEERNIPDGTFVLDEDLVETPMPVFGAPPGEQEGGGFRSLLKRKDG